MFAFLATSRSFKSHLEAFPEAQTGGRALSWVEIEGLARRLPAKTNLVVPKERVEPALPYARTRIGRPRGALRQFRCERARGNVHVKEYERHWVVHVDTYHPRHHPIRHILVDHGFVAMAHLDEFFRVAAPTPAALE